MSSRIDDMLLKAACTIADSVGRFLGSRCEVAVHDLRDPAHSLVHLVNGHVTGRQTGSPIRDLIYRVLPEMDAQEGGLFNYGTVLQDGRRLKSSTVLLRNDRREPVVAFCVNLDITALSTVSEALGELTRVDDAARGRPADEADDATRRLPGDDVGEILRFLVGNTVRRMGRRPDELTKRERQTVVDFLYRKGAFRVKGAVRLVAQELGTSEPTIYRYLNELQWRAGQLGDPGGAGASDGGAASGAAARTPRGTSARAQRRTGPARRQTSLVPP